MGGVSIKKICFYKLYKTIGYHMNDTDQTLKNHIGRLEADRFREAMNVPKSSTRSLTEIVDSFNKSKEAEGSATRATIVLNK